jgi:phenylpropionate dioxygenase-like ring-hydroxylating dioxygenase large terminal subunit
MFLRDLWYFGALSSELKTGKHLHRELLGQPVLFGRDHNGKAFAMLDICPHRAMLLSGGEMQQHGDETHVECPYHGWRFRTDGSCAAIPSLTPDQAEAMDLSKIRTRSFPVHEDQGLIWIYYGEDEASEPCIDPPHLDMPAGAKPRMIVKDVFNCHIDHAVIGLMDPAHIPYIHRQWWYRTKASVKEKEKAFGPIERGFSMLPHVPSSNSFVYKFFGKDRTTEIQFQLPGLRTEYFKADGKHMTIFAAVSPTNENQTAVTIVTYWNHPLMTLVPAFIRRWMGETFLGQDRDAVNAQQVGLAYDPKLMLIHDSDVQAKWYFKLKDAWTKHRKTGDTFKNPVKPAKLRWRS